MTVKNFFPLFILLLLLAPFCSFSQKTDLLFLRNGDKITGEIKKLQYGVLTFKTDDIETITINWSDVMRLRSINRFELTVSSGTIQYGSLDTTSKSREIVLVLDSERKAIDMDDLAKAIPIKSTFVSRLDGNIKLGVNYSKSSDVFKFNVSGAITYRSLHDKISLSGNSEITRQKQTDTVEVTKKQDLNLGYNRYFKKRWFVAVFGGLEQNTGLGLKLRTSLGTGGGKELFQNHLHTLNTSVGVIGNHESATDGTSTINFESALLLDYRIYKYTIPKVILYTNLYTIPSLSNPGRVRLTGNINVDFEFFKDFIFSISNYHNYDNRPASAGASTYDWGITTSIGYSF